MTDHASPAWEVVARVRALRAQEQSLRSIADALTADGVPTPSGRGVRWHPSQVARLLTQESREVNLL